MQTYLLLGGGVVLARFATWLMDIGKDVRVYSSNRLLDAFVRKDCITLAQELTKNDIPYISCNQISNEVSLEGIDAESIVLLSFGAPWIFPSEFIGRWKGRLLNVHGAPLPEQRGAGGFTWRILINDRRGASLIHQVDEGIDTGPIVVSNTFRFPESCIVPVDFERVQQKSDLSFLKKFVRTIDESGIFEIQTQNDSHSTYFPRLYTPIHGAVDWSWNAAMIVRFIRAFDQPYPGAFSSLNGQKIFLRDAHEADSDMVFHPFQAGIIYRANKTSVWIASGSRGGVKIGFMKSEDQVDLLDSGLVGFRSITPVSWLDEARAFRAVYNPDGLVGRPA